MSSSNQKDVFDFQAWRCPICKESEEKMVGLRGGSSHRHGLGVETQIVRCKKCGLLYPNPFPVPRSLQKIYGDPVSYFVRHDYSEKIAASKTLMQNAAKRLKQVKFKSLDIGAGRGELVHAAIQDGFDIVGLELSEAMIAAAKEHYNITLVNQSIESHAESHPNTYDFICMNSVLEHVYDPDSMINAASKLVSDKGLLFIELPNEPNLHTRIGNFVNRIRGSTVVYNLSPTWSPYHVYGFNPPALRTLLSKYGLEIVEVKISSGHTILSDGSLKDRIKSFIANAINVVANLTGTASNMMVWAKKIK